MSEEELIGKSISTLVIMTSRLAHMLVWHIFVMAHMSLVVAALVLLWVFQISPGDIKAVVTQFFQATPVLTIGQILAFLGVSGLAIVWGYAKLWRRLLRRWISSFLLAPPIS